MAPPTPPFPLHPCPRRQRPRRHCVAPTFTTNRINTTTTTIWNASTERHRRIWPMNSSSPRISGPEPAYDRRWPHNRQSAVHGCRLSETSCSCRRRPHLERPVSPRHVHIISACLPKPSEDAPLPTFFPETFVQCLQSDSCHYWHSNRSFYLLTCLYCCYYKNNDPDDGANVAEAVKLFFRRSNHNDVVSNRWLERNDTRLQIFGTWFKGGGKLPMKKKQPDHLSSSVWHIFIHNMNEQRRAHSNKF